MHIETIFVDFEQLTQYFMTRQFWFCNPQQITDFLPWIAAVHLHVVFSQINTDLSVHREYRFGVSTENTDLCYLPRSFPALKEHIQCTLRWFQEFQFKVWRSKNSFPENWVRCQQWISLSGMFTIYGQIVWASDRKIAAVGKLKRRKFGKSLVYFQTLDCL